MVEITSDLLNGGAKGDLCMLFISHGIQVRLVWPPELQSPSSGRHDLNPTEVFIWMFPCWSSWVKNGSLRVQCSRMGNIFLRTQLSPGGAWWPWRVEVSSRQVDHVSHNPRPHIICQRVKSSPELEFHTDYDMSRQGDDMSAKSRPRIIGRDAPNRQETCNILQQVPLTAAQRRLKQRSDL